MTIQQHEVRDAGSVTLDTSRLAAGFGWGVVATIAMSVLMIAGTVSGVSPMPKPIPVALVARTFGPGLAKPLLMVLTIALHLSYGGVFGGVLAGVSRRVTVASGVLLGLFLWLMMQIAWLPYLGWGAFGSTITLSIAMATLVLHLVYGVAVGWLIDRGGAGA